MYICLYKESLLSALSILVDSTFTYSRNFWRFLTTHHFIKMYFYLETLSINKTEAPSVSWWPVRNPEIACSPEVPFSLRNHVEPKGTFIRNLGTLSRPIIILRDAPDFAIGIKMYFKQILTLLCHFKDSKFEKEKNLKEFTSNLFFLHKALLPYWWI